eukprot:TRINITY_DN25187_c0_g1_i1.p1 TRINITY_DN25187_c0_g1~~TRINITY_DN25187_c0_g1_i1.p1  ORF type:complete len:1022 (+),score=361.92 TRINITY_DN25187_c0_g1_i1:94-3159(+)
MAVHYDAEALAADGAALPVIDDDDGVEAAGPGSDASGELCEAVPVQLPPEVVQAIAEEEEWVAVAPELEFTLGGAGARSGMAVSEEAQALDRVVSEILADGNRVVRELPCYDLSRWLRSATVDSRPVVELPAAAAWQATMGLLLEAGSWGHAKKQDVVARCGQNLHGVRKPVARKAAAERVPSEGSWVNFPSPSAALGGAQIDQSATVIGGTYHTTTAWRFPPDGSAPQRGRFIGTCALHASDDGHKRELMSSCIVEFWQGPDPEGRAAAGAPPAFVFGRHGRADTGQKAEQLAALIGMVAQRLGCGQPQQQGGALIRRSCTGKLRVRTASLLNALSIDKRELGFFRQQRRCLTETREEEHGTPPKGAKRGRRRAGDKGAKASGGDSGMTGWLIKQGGQRKNWKLRHFALQKEGRALEYREVCGAGGGGALKGSIPISEVTQVCRAVGEDVLSPGEALRLAERAKAEKVPLGGGAWDCGGFEVHTRRRIYRLMAESEHETLRWMHEIERALPAVLRSQEAEPALLPQLDDPDLRQLRAGDALSKGSQWDVLGRDGSVEDTCAVSECGGSIVWRGGEAAPLERLGEGRVKFLGSEAVSATEASCGKRTVVWDDGDVWEERQGDFDFPAAMNRLGVEHAYLNFVANWPLGLRLGAGPPHGRHNAAHPNALRRHLVWLAQDARAAHDQLPRQAQEYGGIALRVQMEMIADICAGDCGDDPWGDALPKVRGALAGLVTAARRAGADHQERSSELFMAAESLGRLAECKGNTFRRRAQELLQLACLERILGVVPTFNCKSGIDRCGCLAALWTSFWQLVSGSHSALWRWHYLALMYPVVLKAFHGVAPCDNGRSAKRVPVSELRDGSDLHKDAGLPYAPTPQQDPTGDYSKVQELIAMACPPDGRRSQSPLGRGEGACFQLLEGLFFSAPDSILRALQHAFFANQFGVTARIAACSTGCHGLKYGDSGGGLCNALSAQFMPPWVRCADGSKLVQITEVRSVLLAEEIAFCSSIHPYIVGAASGRGT